MLLFERPMDDADCCTMLFQKCMHRIPGEPNMEFLTHSFMGLFLFLPSILLLFWVYLILQQSKLLNKRLNDITQLLSAIHDEQLRADPTRRVLKANRPE
jgi:hypothetical protein